MIGHFAAAVRNIKQSGSNARLMLEVGCIEWISRATALDIGAAISRPNIDAPPPKPTPKPAPEPVITKQPATFDWLEFCQTLEPLLASFAKKARVGCLGDNTLYIICPDKATESQLQRKMSVLAQKLAPYHQNKEIALISQTAYDGQIKAKGGEDNDPALEALRELIDFEIEII